MMMISGPNCTSYWIRNCTLITCTLYLVSFPIAASKSLGDARIACVFFLALGKTFGAKCIIYFHTVPKALVFCYRESDSSAADESGKCWRY